MKRIPYAAAWVLLVTVWAPALAGAQQAAPPSTITLAPEQMEVFLLNAKILRMRDAGGGGITNSQRATLSDGTVTHDAHVQFIDQSLSVFKPPTGPQEFNFKDSYRYNIAGYRLALLLGLDNVPMSVERSVNGKRASVTWWIDDVLMDERTRVRKNATSPDRERTAMQVHIMRVFDELIQNRDRNLGNLVWTTDWKMWMIDHTRAFRLATALSNPKLLERVERSLLEHLRALTQDAVSKAVGTSLTRFEIETLLTRRDAIVKLFEAKIAERGESSTVYALPR
ncbi:MAG: hypothetical protein ACRD3C_25575 [Vicinamibacterales bacterium]